MKKNGFTLIELLAVIAILAILAIIVVPNVLSSLKNSKQKIFVTSYQTLYKSVEGYIIKEQLSNPLTPVNKTFSDICNDGVKLDGYEPEYNYYVRIEDGKIKNMRINNKDYMIKISDDNIKIEDVSLDDIVEYNEGDSICPIIIM